MRIALEQARSMNAPGIALVGIADEHISSRPASARQSSHFIPVGKPPPPRPRSPEL